jgi:hypothetical protein
MVRANRNLPPGLMMFSVAKSELQWGGVGLLPNLHNM